MLAKKRKKSNHPPLHKLTFTLLLDEIHQFLCNLVVSRGSPASSCSWSFLPLSLCLGWSSWNEEEGHAFGSLLTAFGSLFVWEQTPPTPPLDLLTLVLLGWLGVDFCLYLHHTGLRTLTDHHWLWCHHWWSLGLLLLGGRRGGLLLTLLTVSGGWLGLWRVLLPPHCRVVWRRTRETLQNLSITVFGSLLTAFNRIRVTFTNRKHNYKLTKISYSELGMSHLLQAFCLWSLSTGSTPVLMNPTLMLWGDIPLCQALLNTDQNSSFPSVLPETFLLCSSRHTFHQYLKHEKGFLSRGCR